MTLKSGADVKIGAYEFFLDDTAQEPYSHVFKSLYSDTQKIAGMEATTADPNILLWPYDDFAGGVENKYYSELIPDTWWYGNANPRVRGSITAPPDSTLSNFTQTVSTPTKAYFVAVADKLWLAVGRDLFYSTDGETWFTWNSTTLFGAGYIIDGMTHDGANPWVTASNGTTRKTTKVTSTTTSTTAIADRATTEVQNGMAMLEGQIYQWTGSKLYKYDSTATLPITHDDTVHKVHQPFAAGGTYFGIAATDNSIIYFSAANGYTEVFEYRFSSATNSFIPRPIWKPSPGFTARFICCNMGVYYLLGDYLDQCAIFGMSSVNREPLFLSYVGQQFAANGVSLTPRALAPSYGTNVILCVDDGTNNYYFVYDAEIDSLSPLDQQSMAGGSIDGTTLTMATYRNRRVRYGTLASVTGKYRFWKQDFDTPTRSWEWVSSAWSLGYPMDEKLLFGFEVVCDPSIAAGTVQVLYQIDESGSWVSAGTTSAGVKYTNIDISANNVKFRNLRMRMLGTSGARVFSITARTYVNAYQEIWRLVVKMRDENPNDRPRNRQARAAKLRAWLNQLAKDKNVVTFLDGRVSPVKGTYSTNRVVVEFAPYGGQRIARAQGHYEGAAEIQLRSTVPVSTS
jgi:hypothetical protein